MIGWWQQQFDRTTSTLKTSVLLVSNTSCCLLATAGHPFTCYIDFKRITAQVHTISPQGKAPSGTPPSLQARTRTRRGHADHKAAGNRLKVRRQQAVAEAEADGQQLVAKVRKLGHELERHSLDLATVAVVATEEVGGGKGKMSV